MSLFVWVAEHDIAIFVANLCELGGAGVHPVNGDAPRSDQTCSEVIAVHQAADSMKNYRVQPALPRNDRSMPTRRAAHGFEPFRNAFHVCKATAMHMRHKVR